MPNEITANVPGAVPSSATQTDQHSTPLAIGGAIGKSTITPLQSTAARPEDLGVTPWYIDDYPVIDGSPGPTVDRSSYPSCSYADKETANKLDLTSTRNSSMDSEIPRPSSISTAPRKAYMDLRDAIALLDETCPNQDVSPSLTPRTPRTPLTPYPRNKRARSKSSDNSSNYSNDRLSDRSFDAPRQQDKEKKRPFLKKIGISMTEDKPFLAKLAPKIIGKPYLEKIGPSKAIERPFLDKIGSSKTLDKFIFDTPRYERRNGKNEGEKSVIKDEGAKRAPETTKEEKGQLERTCEKNFAVERRRSGKGPLLKMYSFETEDLESTVTKDHRDPLRGASLDDVLDSGPSSLPTESTRNEASKQESEEKPTSEAELLKCRVTTSEEIIFNTGLGSPKGPNSWGNSPRRAWRSKKDTAAQRTPVRRANIQNSRECIRNDDSIPNSPTKRPISNVSPDRQTTQSVSSERNVYSPTKTRRQTFEDILERNGNDEDHVKSSKQTQFERRGISSDNLLSNDRSLVRADQTKNRVDGAREASSEDSLAHRGVNQEYTKETFKQLQDKFKFHEVPTETYADFKRRTRGNLQSLIGRQQDRTKTSVATGIKDEETTKESSVVMTETSKTITSTRSTESAEESRTNTTGDLVRSQGGTIRSVLRKQERIDHPSDQEFDANSSLRRPTRRIFHEPSQETMDLLTELRKVKSLLKTPSWEKDLELDKKPARLPKRILLTDKEFCLSIERENSIRRPSRVMNNLEKTEEGTSCEKEDEQSERIEEKKLNDQTDKSETKIPGPALFEKKCLSLDYADEEKPQRPEPRTISLASARYLPSEADDNIDYSDLALTYDAKSYSSDVFNIPSEETNGKERSSETEITIARKVNRNHCTEIDIAIPIDQKASSPKGGVQIQGRTSDLYEIISPRSTPFRVKKRLGKISVEETVKPESFTLGSKVDCRSAVVQKRTKCFPL